MKLRNKPTHTYKMILPDSPQTTPAIFGELSSTLSSEYLDTLPVIYQRHHLLGRFNGYLDLRGIEVVGSEY